MKIAALGDLATGIAAGWKIEHKADGHHEWNWTFPAYTGGVGVAPDPGRFQGDGTITWTVEAWDRTYEHYGRLGDVMYWSLEISGSSTGGTASSALRVTLPAGLRIKSRSRHMCHVQDAGGTTEVGHVVAVTDLPYVSIRLADGSNWSNAASNNTYVSFTVMLRVY